MAFLPWRPVWTCHRFLSSWTGGWPSRPGVPSARRRRETREVDQAVLAVEPLVPVAGSAGLQVGLQTLLPQRSIAKHGHQLVLGGGFAVKKSAGEDRVNCPLSVNELIDPSKLGRPTFAYIPRMRVCTARGRAGCCDEARCTPLLPQVACGRSMASLARPTRGGAERGEGVLARGRGARGGGVSVSGHSPDGLGRFSRLRAGRDGPSNSRLASRQPRPPRQRSRIRSPCGGRS